MNAVDELGMVDLDGPAFSVIDLETAAVVKSLLVALGNSAAAVANNLELEGCRGERESCGTCPVADYLHRKTGRHFLVSPNGISVEGSPFGEYIPCPLAVATFMDLFDGGRWPALDVAVAISCTDPRSTPLAGLR